MTPVAPASSSSPSAPQRPPRRPVVVGDVSVPAPRFVRVVVAGKLADWPEPGAAAHMKIFLAQPGGDTVLRTYTVRAFDRDRGEVTIDLYLHDGNGPAARFAAAARPGDELQLSGRSRSTFAPDDASAYLFAGDASALPAIATCLETLPATACATVVTTGEYPLESAAALDVRTLDAGQESAFLAAVVSAEAERAWIACEAGLMRKARAELLATGRFTRETLSTRGYWKHGAANHPDHDTGDDDA